MGQEGKGRQAASEQGSSRCETCSGGEGPRFLLLVSATETDLTEHRGHLFSIRQFRHEQNSTAPSDSSILFVHVCVRPSTWTHALGYFQPPFPYFSHCLQLGLELQLEL